MTAFRIYGIPAPQGSKKAFVANGQARLKESGGDAFARWRNQIAEVAYLEAYKLGHAYNEPVSLHVEFRFPMPKARGAKARALRIINKTTAPDVDKLVRALGDGLQAGGLLSDDALIVSLVASKVEVHDDWTGADVWIKPIGETYEGAA